MKNRAPEWIILGLCLIMCGILVSMNLLTDQAVEAGVLLADSQGTEQAVLVNINNATAEELESLPGIGPAIALRIIEYRTKQGRFTSLEELMEVKGIGESAFQKLRSYISIE